MMRIGITYICFSFLLLGCSSSPPSSHDSFLVEDGSINDISNDYPFDSNQNDDAFNNDQKSADGSLNDQTAHDLQSDRSNSDSLSSDGLSYDGLGPDAHSLYSSLCNDYIACLTNIDPNAGAAAENQYGPSSSCWDNLASAQQCMNECRSAYAELALKYPDNCSSGWTIPTDQQTSEAFWKDLIPWDLMVTPGRNNNYYPITTPELAEDNGSAVRSEQYVDSQNQYYFYRVDAKIPKYASMALHFSYDSQITPLFRDTNAWGDYLSLWVRAINTVDVTFEAVWDTNLAIDINRGLAGAVRQAGVEIIGTTQIVGDGKWHHIKVPIPPQSSAAFKDWRYYMHAITLRLSSYYDGNFDVALIGFSDNAKVSNATDLPKIYTTSIPQHINTKPEGLETQNVSTLLNAQAKTNWMRYQSPYEATGAPNWKVNQAIAILLTGPKGDEGKWLALVHGLKALGVPFIVTKNAEYAAEHPVVLAFPTFSPADEDPEYGLDAMDYTLMQNYVTVGGGTLIATMPWGGDFKTFFGVGEPIKDDTCVRSQILFDSSDPTGPLRYFQTAAEKSLYIFSNYKTKPGCHNPFYNLSTLGYPTEPGTTVLAQFMQKVLFPHGDYNPITGAYVFKPGEDSLENGVAAITRKTYSSGGKAYTLGFNPADLTVARKSGSAEGLALEYSFEYRPAVDLIYRLFSTILYDTGHAPTMGTAPLNRDVSLIFTHDVDASEGHYISQVYAAEEANLGVQASYNVTTKIVQDEMDYSFFSTRNVFRHMNNLLKLGMELGTHGLAHADDSNTFPLGSGAEKFCRIRNNLFVPDWTRYQSLIASDATQECYYPEVQCEFTNGICTNLYTTNGSQMGETLVSNYLISAFAGLAPKTWRPGMLSHPAYYPSVLQASTIPYSSTYEANIVGTHLPIQHTINMQGETEIDGFEFPILLDDLSGAYQPMNSTNTPTSALGHSLAVIENLRRYGGISPVLIHPDSPHYDRLAWEVEVIKATKDFAWFGSMRQFADWWTARNNLTFETIRQGTTYSVNIEVKDKIYGLTYKIPENWALSSTTPNTLNIEKTRDFLGRKAIMISDQLENTTVTLVFNATASANDPNYSHQLVDWKTIKPTHMVNPYPDPNSVSNINLTSLGSGRIKISFDAPDNARHAPFYRYRLCFSAEEPQTNFDGYDLVDSSTTSTLNALGKCKDYVKGAFNGVLGKTRSIEVQLFNTSYQGKVFVYIAPVGIKGKPVATAIETKTITLQ